VLAALIASVIALVTWFRSMALGEVERSGPGPSLAHARFANVVSVVLPVGWWMAISITDFRHLAHQRLGLPSSTEQMLAEGVALVAVPCVVFAVCASIWRPVWRALPMKVAIPRSPGRSSVHLFMGAVLQSLLVWGAVYYAYEFEFGVAGPMLIAYGIVFFLYRKLLADRRELEMFALIAPELRQRIFDLAAGAKVRLRGVFVLPDTGRHIANAFAVSNNTIRLSEYLLRRLSRKEVDAIAAHELGHLKGGHIVLRITGLTICLLGGLVPNLFLRAMDAPVQDLNLVFPASLTFGLALYYLLARRFEYSADWWSVKINGDPEATITGLVRVTGDGQLPLNWSKWDEKLLTHPSTVRRAARIARKSGITKDRLAELLSVTGQSEGCYSLAPGLPTPVPPASSGPPVAGPKARKIRRSGIRYCAMPPAAAFGIFFTALIALSLWPNQEVWGEHLLGFSVLLYYFIFSILLGLAAMALTARFLKTKLSQGVTKPFAFAAAEGDQFPGLDAAAFHSYATELGALGFVVEGDHSMPDGGGSSLKWFRRLLVNNVHSCWAIAGQWVTETLGVTKVSCSLVSYFADGYLLCTTDADPNAVMYVSRRPREVFVHEPGAAPSGLLTSHLALRNRLAAEAGLSPLPIVSIEQYLESERQRAHERSLIVRGLNAWLFLLRIDWFNRRPKMEWAGRDKRICDVHPGKKH
jgi:Zn-dependent protease with chaperone function